MDKSYTRSIFFTCQLIRTWYFTNQLVNGDWQCDWLEELDNEEGEGFVELVELLGDVCPYLESDERRRKIPNPSGTFTVNFCYKFLLFFFFFERKFLLSSKPQVLLNDNVVKAVKELHHKGITDPHCVSCVFRFNTIEHFDYLFFLCQLVKKVCTCVFQWFGG